MDNEQWINYVNQHINPDSDLPCLDVEKLERWGRLQLLVPPGGGYELTNLERTLNFKAYTY